MSDSEFDTAWRTFADADRHSRAPARVRDAVMATWGGAGEPHQRALPTRRPVARAAVGFAAMLVIGIASSLLVRSRFEIGPLDSSPDARPNLDAPAIQSAIAVPEAPRRVTDAEPFDGVRAERAAHVTRVVRGVDATVPQINSPGAVISVTAEPDVAVESLQLVRLRVPRTALQAFGVALIEPDATGLVDVDLVVGSDGLPRDIRRVRPVVDVRSDPNELEQYR